MRAELRNVRTFVAVADAGNVARAASRLHLSQPAASRQIHALEAELGVALFDRIGRALRLTAEGEDLLPNCRRLLLDAQALDLRAGELRKGEVGVLRVGATPQVIENLLSQFVARYRARHSGVDVHLVEDGGALLPRRLATGDIQLAVMPEGDASFEQRPLYPMHLMVVVASGHRLARRRAVELGQLADQVLLLLKPGFASRVWFDAISQVARVKASRVIESAVPQTLLALARDGHGIALVPSPVSVPSSGVCSVPLVHRGASVGRWAVLAWDPRRPLARHASTFIDELLAQLRSDYPGRVLVRRAPAMPRP